MPLTPEQIDALLPQTQCGLCGYAGCMPYANAIVANEADINLCLPGGIPTLRELATLTQKDDTPYLAEMEQKQKYPSVVSIREPECIGCTKCIQACPVDAIIGSAKKMHTVITDECTGCDLCIPVCPVDCIDIIKLPVQQLTKKQSDEFRARYLDKKRRQDDIHSLDSKMDNTPVTNKQQLIAEAIARSKKKSRA